MPLAKIESTSRGVMGLWHIEENEEALRLEALPTEMAADSLRHPVKRLEWYAGRVLVRTLMDHLGQAFQGVSKDEFGKPFPTGSDYHLALSHSYPYVAALLDRHESAGIDLEQPKDKLIKIAPRVFDATELGDAGADLTKLCIYWCAKEALIKYYGKKDLTLAHNLKIAPFTAKTEGEVIGKIIATGNTRTISLRYRVTEEFVCVWSNGTVKQ